MGKYKDGSYSCNAGILLIAKVLAGRCAMRYTKVKVGSGTLQDDQSPRDMAEPAGYVMDAAIRSVTNPVGGECQVTVQINSADVEEGFFATCLVLYAYDPDEGEVPYTYLYLENEPEWIRPKTSIVGKLATFDIIAAVGAVDNVSAVIDPNTIVTAAAAKAMIKEHDEDPEAHASLRQSISDLEDTVAATAGGCATKITFGPGCAGWSYTITDGKDETYTGTVPDTLSVMVVLRKCATEYTITATDGHGSIWTNKIVTGDYYGPCEVEVTSFAATLTVSTSEGAEVRATCGRQIYTAKAEGGTAELQIGTKGKYTVLAILEDKTVTGFVDITESKSYTLELREFRPDLNLRPVARGYRVFETEDWTGQDSAYTLRIPQTEHGIEPVAESCMCALHQRVARTALDYTDATAQQGRTAIINAEKAALDANKAQEGTYPTAVAGYPQLTWEQVQYYILEGTLVPSAEAATAAQTKGFNWQERDTTGVEQTSSLEDVLNAAYLPALEGASTSLDALCTAQVLRGLRLRKRADDAPASVEKYDLDGTMKASTWGVLGSRTHWDVATKDLVVESEAPFAGDILVMG